MSLVEVRGLCKDYPSFRLADITFDLGAGRIAGFIGRNGAGKTTTIKSMLNLVHPSSGEVSYFGLPLAGNEAAIKGRIGYTTGVANYYPKRKIAELMDVARAFYPTWDSSAYQRFLRLFELDESKSPSELSDGMKIKCNLLLALSHHADVLILDEPTSGLDPFSRDELLELLRVLADEGVAILFSTHITSDLEKCADDIIYIRHGRLATTGTKKEFQNRFGQTGETLEETMLRLEREARS